MRLGAIAAGLLLAIAPLAPAQAQDALNIINDPGAPQVNGATARLRDDPAVQGGKALRIQVKRKGANPWDIAAQSAISKPVAAGDQLLLAFWVRLEKGEGGATTGTINYSGIQLGSAPYTTLLSSSIELGPEWKLAEIRGKADRDYAAGTLNATIHLASAAHTVDLGPIFVVNLGPE
jgi:hypothetical protein